MASSINWTDGPSGGTPLSAANLNKLAVVADVGTSGTPTGDALRAAFVPVPTGGADGQVLGKSGSNVVWLTQSGGGSGGTSVTDNGDGTASTTSTSVVDNGDGTAAA